MAIILSIRKMNSMNKNSTMKIGFSNLLIVFVLGVILPVGVVCVYASFNIIIDVLNDPNALSETWGLLAVTLAFSVVCPFQVYSALVVFFKYKNRAITVNRLGVFWRFPMNTGFVAWTNVNLVDLKHFRGSFGKQLCFGLKDTDCYLRSRPYPNRILDWLNTTFYKAPIFLPAIFLRCSIVELVAELERYRCTFGFEKDDTADEIASKIVELLGREATKKINRETMLQIIERAGK